MPPPLFYRANLGLRKAPARGPSSTYWLFGCPRISRANTTTNPTMATADRTYNASKTYLLLPRKEFLGSQKDLQGCTAYTYKCKLVVEFWTPCPNAIIPEICWPTPFQALRRDGWSFGTPGRHLPKGAYFFCAILYPEANSCQLDLTPPHLPPLLWRERRSGLHFFPTDLNYHVYPHLKPLRGSPDPKRNTCPCPMHP